MHYFTFLGWGKSFMPHLKRHIALASMSARPNDGMKRGGKKKRKYKCGRISKVKNWQWLWNPVYSQSAAGLKQNTQPNTWRAQSFVKPWRKTKHQQRQFFLCFEFIWFFCSGEWVTLNLRSLMFASSDRIRVQAMILLCKWAHEWQKKEGRKVPAGCDWITY